MFPLLAFIYVTTSGTVGARQEDVRAFLRHYDIIIPEVIDRKRNKRRPLNRSRERIVEGSKTYTIPTLSGNFTLDLNLDRYIVAGDLTHFYVDNGTRVREQVKPSACYYSGTVRDFVDSSVAMTTCDGLRGSFRVDKNTYVIEPYPSESETNYHIMYNTKDYNRNATLSCGTKHKSHVDEIPLNVNDDVEYRRRRRNAFSRQRYHIKILYIVDQRACSHYRSVKDMVDMIVRLTQKMNQLYKPLNIQLLAVGVNTWCDGNQIEQNSNDMEATLASLAKWTYDNVPKGSSDVTALIKGDGTSVFDSQSSYKRGWAFRHTLCTISAGAIILHDHKSIEVMSVSLAHEIGHLLNLGHDDTRRTCHSCSDSSGCIMSEIFSAVPLPSVWNGCTSEDLNEYTFDCLIQTPVLPQDSRIPTQCGNGVVERNEECDCGQDCTNNPCCNTNCKLTSGSQCGSGACCYRCKFKPAGSSCRGARDECDLPEVCNGLSPHCPEKDAGKPDGSKCDAGKHYCYQARCVTLSNQCSYLFNTPEAALRRETARCYAFNARGDKLGYCSVANNGNYLPCARQDVGCGVLFCNLVQHAGEVPISRLHLATAYYLKCMYVLGSEDFGRHIGFVQDGTKCGAGKWCNSGKCVLTNSSGTEGFCILKILLILILVAAIL